MRTGRTLQFAALATTGFWARAGAACAGPAAPDMLPLVTERYYERQGLLPVPTRRASGYRSYDVVFGAAIAVSVGSFAHDPKTAMQPMAGTSVGSMQLHRIMTKKMAMPTTGNVDKDFAAMMSIHHQMAIDMVDVLDKYGSNPELKALGAKMKAAQTEEIKQLAAYK